MHGSHATGQVTVHHISSGLLARSHSNVRLGSCKLRPSLCAHALHAQAQHTFTSTNGAASLSLLYGPRCGTEPRPQLT